jgi:hypothetical protein
MFAQSQTNTMAGPSTEPHIAALHQSLIPNWTSAAFSKFVDACRGLVDELAISPTIANGKEEMMRCEQVFRQVCYLAERFWPDVDSAMSDIDDHPHHRALTMHDGQPSLGAMQNGVVQAARAANEVVQEGTFAGLGADNQNGQSS